MCPTPNSVTVCIWFGLRPHSLYSHGSLAYMRPLASYPTAVLESAYCPTIKVCLVWSVCALPILTGMVCSPCERTWCIWFGPLAAYQSLPASTCKGHWILVRSGRPLPRLTIHYHASILSLHRPLTFTSHHLRGDTHEHTVHEPCVVRVMWVLNGLLG